MSEAIHQLIYCSRNTMDGSRADTDQEIVSILDKARRRNARDGITGALLFSRSSFAQVLEGPLAAIERTFERIQRDSRHGDVVILAMRPAARRHFADWSMAFAGRLTTPEAEARLARACNPAEPDGPEAVMAMLQDLVQREEDWLALP